MSDQEKWRDRYLQLAEQLDGEEKRRQEAERELLRLISRLCVATTGLDPLLDPHLSRLRKAVKKGTPERLIEQAQELGDALLKAQDDRVQGDLFERLLARTSLSSKQLKPALKLWRRLAEARQDTTREAGSGLLGRLLHRGGQSDPNALLREVIDAIDWPDDMRQRVDALREQLAEGAPRDAWVEVVREIGNMAATALDRAHRDAEASSVFLAQLSERLEALDDYMLGDSERRRPSRESGMRLGRAVSSEVGGLSARMEENQGLAQLREQVIQTLDRIQQHVATHIKDEAQRDVQAEQQAALMKRQLEALEREAFDLRRQVEETRQQAMRDPLTGLPNRRAFEARIDEELARWRRFGTPLALVVFDVDDFKQINDVFGHKAGDRALALIGKILAESLRETDFLARYGGEEIVGLLPGADGEAALKVADMMRRQVEQAGMHSHNKPVKITLSGGVAVAGPGETAEQLFERADQAMYQAKRAGKNRCVLADPPAGAEVRSA